MRTPTHTLAAAAALALTVAAAPAQDMIGLTLSGSLYAVDSFTGQSELLGAGLFGHQSLARDDAGDLWTVSRTLLGIPQYFLTRISPDSLAIEVVAPAVDTRALAYEGNGKLLAIEFVPGSNFLTRIDLATGVRTFVGSTGQDIQGLTMHQGTLYAWSIGAGLGTIDPLTGAFTDVGPGGGSDEVQWLAERSDGALIGGGYDFFTIDVQTGFRTLYASGDVYLQGCEPTGMVRTVGTGCYGVALNGSGSLRPGSVLTTRSTGYPSTGALVGIGGALLVGTSKTDHQGAPLPIDLDPLLGTEGCALYISVDNTRLDFTTGGAAPSLFFPVAIPAGYHDATFFVQHAGFDFTGAFYWSNAIEVHVAN
ncbi:MAG: hypothetical protein H6835_11325 [Planctomycetes bacterium]|nr:hypothetical protein [Planctomycetota bacterium]